MEVCIRTVDCGSDGGVDLEGCRYCVLVVSRIHTHTHMHTHMHIYRSVPVDLDTTLTALRGPKPPLTSPQPLHTSPQPLHTSPQRDTTTSSPLQATFVKESGTSRSRIASSPDRPCRVVLSQEGYYCIPPLDELDRRTRNAHCEVENFTVGRKGVGKVFFPGKTDVFGLNLDELGKWCMFGDLLHLEGTNGIFFLDNVISGISFPKDRVLKHLANKNCLVTPIVYSN